MGWALTLPDNLNSALAANFQFDVGVGIDENSGVYVHLDDSKTDDIHLDFQATLAGGGPLTAELGFLTLDLINNRTEAAAEFDIDLQPGVDDRIYLGEIFSTPIETVIFRKCSRKRNRQ